MFDDAVWINVAFVAAGFIAHILKKAGTENINVIEYLSVHKARTYTALSAMIASFATMYLTTPDASPLEFFALGYLADSLLNRTPTPLAIEAHRNKKKGS